MSNERWTYKDEQEDSEERAASDPKEAGGQGEAGKEEEEKVKHKPPWCNGIACEATNLAMRVRLLPAVLE